MVGLIQYWCIYIYIYIRLCMLYDGLLKIELNIFY